jgi:hypothetical protein
MVNIYLPRKLFHVNFRVVRRFPDVFMKSMWIMSDVIQNQTLVASDKTIERMILFKYT